MISRNTLEPLENHDRRGGWAASQREEVEREVFLNGHHSLTFALAQAIQAEISLSTEHYQQDKVIKIK